MIPSSIKRVHVEKAIRDIDSSGIPKSRQSTKYDLLYEGKRYSPKYVLTRAAFYATGKELQPSEFSGGRGFANDFLEKLGFTIEAKDGAKTNGDLVILQRYIDAFKNLHVDKVGEFEAPYKPALLLAVLDLIGNAEINENRIEFNEFVLTKYKATLESVGKPKDNNMVLPFFHMSSERFWHLHPKPGQEKKLQDTPKMKARFKMRELVSHATLDPDLYELILQPSTCLILRNSLLLRYFPYSMKTDITIEAIRQEAEAFGEFDPESIEDARNKTLTEIVRRQGQPQFRESLLKWYDGRCLVTGCDVEEALESAHIVAYQGKETNHPSNGLLLRADIHTLFDLGLIAIDSVSARVLLSSRLKGTTYSNLEGKVVKPPGGSFTSATIKALNLHRQKTGL